MRKIGILLVLMIVAHPAILAIKSSIPVLIANAAKAAKALKQQADPFVKNVIGRFVGPGKAYLTIDDAMVDLLFTRRGDEIQSLRSKLAQQEKQSPSSIKHSKIVGSESNNNDALPSTTLKKPAKKDKIGQVTQPSVKPPVGLALVQAPVGLELVIEDVAFDQTLKELSKEIVTLSSSVKDLDSKDIEEGKYLPMLAEIEANLAQAAKKIRESGVQNIALDQYKKILELQDQIKEIKQLLTGPAMLG